MSTEVAGTGECMLGRDDTQDFLAEVFGLHGNYESSAARAGLDVL